MSDRVFLVACGAVAALVVVVALVWPQGEGARSPAPFGHATVSEQAAAAAKAGKAKPPANAAGAGLRGPTP